MAEFQGAVAVVTGAGGGIGAAVTKALTEAGATVAALDLPTPHTTSPAAARGWDASSVLSDVAAGTARDAVGRVVGGAPIAVGEYAARVPVGGEQVVPFSVDVRDAAAVERAVAEIEERLGPIGVLVNVAGVLRPAPVVEIADEDWADTFAVNAGGVFHASRAVARRMVPRRAGSIVTVGSNAAGVPRTRLAAYAAAKAAAAQFTRCLGLELAEYGIRCNVVSPGSTDTRMLSVLSSDTAAIDGDPAAYRTGIPLRRVATPADIADAVLFLLSPKARHITMHDLYVDGGATLRA